MKEVPEARPPSDKRAEKDLVSALAYSQEFWEYARVLTPSHFTDKQAKSVFQQMKDMKDQDRTWIVLDDFPFLPVVALPELHVEETVKRLIELHYRRQHFFRAHAEVKAALDGDIEKLQELSVRDSPKMTDYVNGRIRYSGHELVKVEFPPDPYLVDGLIRSGGNNLVAGDFGSGKTTASIEEAIGIADGTTAWGRECRKGKVLYFRLDNPQEDLQKLLKDLCAGREIAIPEDITFDFSPLDFSDGATFPFLREQILE